MKKEQEFIEIIKSNVKNSYIGDDCAYLKNYGITLSQDNLVEDVHFSTKYTTPYELGYKSAMVNISDIAASGAKPKFLTVGLSLPKTTNNNFIKEFYKGIKKACNGVEIVGGDITSSDKIFISISAIGDTKNRKISSRSNAKTGYKIVTSGNHGSSGAGLRELQQGHRSDFNKIHLMPDAQVEFSEYIATHIKDDYAMIDSSDGLMDALLQISKSSNVLLSINFDKIPYDKNLEKYSDYKDLVLYGGEDYQLIACVPCDFEIPNSYTIGYVNKGFGIEIDNKKIANPEDKIYNHFEL